MNRRRVIWYSILLLIAGGLLGWQWWTARRDDADWAALVEKVLHEQDDDAQKEAVQALRKRCQSDVRHEDSKWLERKRRTLQAVLDAFQSDDPEVRTRAPEAVYEAAGLDFYERPVKRMADDKVDEEMRPAAVRALIVAINDKDTEVRASALSYLAQLATLPASAVPDLIACVQDDNPELRRSAFLCLVRIGPEVVPALRTALATAADKKRPYLETCLKAFVVAKDG